MNPERLDFPMSESERKIVPTKRPSSTDADAKEQERKRLKPSREDGIRETTAPSDVNVAISRGKQRRIVVEKYLPVFLTEYKLEQSQCVICMNELEQLCPSCEEKELQAANASPQNQFSNVVESCQIIWGKCNHVFHDHCLQKWFEQGMFKRDCPLDRKYFRVAKKKD